jgi:hypothetical protein
VGTFAKFFAQTSVINIEALCPIIEHAVTLSNSPSAAHSTLFKVPDIVDRELIPSDTSLHKAYQFYERYTALGGSNVINVESYNLIVGCTEMMEIIENPLF